MTSFLKTLFILTLGVLLGAALTFLSGSGLFHRTLKASDKAREHAFIKTLVGMGNARWCNESDDPRGFKFIVHLHSSQRDRFPNEEFVATDLPHTEY